jgi:pimeloyl-ACP methyl ester carboxylesterase
LALGFIPYGGADFGEIAAVASAVGDGDDAAFYRAWVAAADRLQGEAEDELRGGRRVSARELYLRASAFYGYAYRPLFGEPVDQRLLDAYRKQIAAFTQGLALFEAPVAPARIPFEGTTMPAYLIAATGMERVVRPLVILTNGYDATATDLYFASAVALTRRGYHCLIFDGPGQGEMLFEQGVHLRPDWENVVAAVVDFAEAQPFVDVRRIAIAGWSLGGYLAPRAASGERRLRACIADPGLFSMAAAFGGFARQFGIAGESIGSLSGLDAAVLDRMWQAIQNDRRLRWTIVQRGFWVNGASELREYLRSIEGFTLEGRLERIACPTLVCAAERDQLSATAQSLYDALRCPKTFIPFAAADGAADHCEILNRSLFNRRAIDWLDENL